VLSPCLKRLSYLAGTSPTMIFSGQEYPLHPGAFSPPDQIQKNKVPDSAAGLSLLSF
jgi:hypothetical protein